MGLLLFANNAGTTLAGSISSTALTLNVASGTGAEFPNPGVGEYFLVTLSSSGGGVANEIVQVTARNGDQFTIVRGQEGTAPGAWNAGDNVRELNTAGAMATMVQVAQLQAQLTNWGNDSGVANAYAVALTPSVASNALLTGMPIRFRAQNSNTGTSTLSVNGLPTIPIVTPDGNALKPYAIVAGGVVEIVPVNSVAYLVGGAGTVEGAAMAITGNGTVGGALAVGSTLSSGSASISGNLTLTGEQYFNNNVGIYWKNSSGNYQVGMFVDTSNNLNLYSFGGRSRILNPSGTAELFALDSAGNAAILGGLTVEGANGLSVSASLGVVGNATVGGSLVLEHNNAWVYGTATTGYIAQMIGVDNANNTTIYNLGGGYVRFVNQANTVNLMLCDNAGNMTVAGSLTTQGLTTPWATIQKTGSAAISMISNGIREYEVRVDNDGFFVIQDATSGLNDLYFDTAGNAYFGAPVWANGDVTAGNARLRATYGARGSGDPNAATILADFVSYRGGAGCDILPDGTYIQWGTGNLVNTIGASFSFFTKFPTACERVIVCEANGAGTWPGGQPTIYAASATTTSAFVVYGYLWNGSSWVQPTIITFSYLAIGY